MNEGRDGSYVDYIDDTTWQRVVGALLDSDGVEISAGISRDLVGLGAGTSLNRVAGTPARVADDRSTGRW